MRPPIDRIFEWFDWHAWGYWAIALSALGLLVTTVAASVVAREQSTGSRLRRFVCSRALFTLAVLLTFFAFRWPAFFAGQMENPDEAQWIAGALTFRAGGLPWKSVDGQTSGPLNPCALLLTRPLGLPMNYIGARVLASLFLVASLLALHAAVRRSTPEWIARLAVLPAVPLWAFGSFHDLLQFSSEHVPVLLLALAGWAAAVAFDRRSGRWSLLLLLATGSLSSAPFFAKPQSLPLALTLLTLVVGGIWFSESTAVAPASPVRRRVETTALLVGTLLPLVVFASYISIYGLWGQIRVFFWQSNALYTIHREYSFSAIPEAFFQLANPAPGLTAALLGTVGFCLISLVPTWTAPGAARARLLSSWGLLGAALIAVVTSGRYFTHYLHFLVLPLCWCSAVHLDGFRAGLADEKLAGLWRSRGRVALVFALAVLAWPTWQRLDQYRPMNGQLFFWRQRQTSPLADRIRAEARPGDTLVVWGWAPGFHVETGLPQGVRDAHCGLIINPGPLQSNYRDRFLFDFRRHRPRWFIDAVAPGQFGYRERALFGHDTWPALREIIAGGYELVDERAGVRLYRRRD